MRIGKLAAVALLIFGTIAANDVAPSNSELEAMYDKAFRAFDAANYDQALKELDAIDARKPDLSASQNLRGVIYMRQGLYDKAEAALSESQRLDPKFWNARFNLAEIPFLKKDWPEARKRFQALLNSNAADLQGEATQLIQYKILLTYLLEQNQTMVDSLLAKFELSPDTPAVHYANAAIALQHKNLDEARKWLTGAEKNFSPALNKLFAESLFEVGWLQQPPGEQRTALQLLTPGARETGSKAMAQTQLEQAQQAYEQRDFDRASKLAEEADAAQPNQPAILNLRGEILLEQGKFAEAEQFFSKALKIDGKFREAQFNLADVPFRQKDYAKARERFQALLKQTPGGDKNQAAQLINFKIYMTYLLEGKDSRAQKLMEQFQFSGDTPALYYANAAWEFRHGKTDTANDWIASARKIYPLASNAAYSTGFYDLGWLKGGPSAPSSPAPGAAVDAAAVASAQNESPAPAVEPSPIPGVETKSEANAFVSAQPGASPVAGMEATTAASPALPTPSVAGANVVTANPPAASSPAQLENTPVVASPASSPVEETASAKAAPAASVSPGAVPANTPAVALNQQVPTSPTAQSPALVTNEKTAPATLGASASPRVVPERTAATVLAPANVSQAPQPSFGERLDRLADRRTLSWIALLVVGLGLLGWVGVPELRRRLHAAHVGNHPTPVIGPDLHSPETRENKQNIQKGTRFSGGPRKVSVQLKASEPAKRKPIGLAAKSDPEPTLKEAIESPGVETAESVTGAVAPTEEAVESAPMDVATPVSGALPEIASPNGETQEIMAAEQQEPTTELPSVTAEGVGTELEPQPVPVWQPVSRYADLDESVGPVVEQVPDVDVVPETTAAPEETPVLGALRASEDEEEETILGPQDVAETKEAVSKPSEVSEPPIELEVEMNSTAEMPSEAPVLEELPGSETPGPASTEEPSATEEAVPEIAAAADEPEPVPIEPELVPEPIGQGQPVPYQTVFASSEAAVEEEREMAGVSSAIAGLGALRGAMPSQEDEQEFTSQPTTIHTMPETLQTAPVIRTSADSTQPSPKAPAPHAAAGGIHTAVHITLSCEIASMQLTPTFKMGALQLRPISKVVTMRLAPSQQQQQNGMNFQVNFEIAKVQPAPGSLGQIRLSPSQQQKPSTLNTPSFNVSGLQVVSGFEAAPLQLTPSQQGQASVHLTAAFQIATVEFSPTFDIAAMILNSSSKTVAVQLPGAGGGTGDDGPLFEITNVQLTAGGEIGMLQLNPASAPRRS